MDEKRSAVGEPVDVGCFHIGIPPKRPDPGVKIIGDNHQHIRSH
jgi:hypothetical protein